MSTRQKEKIMVKHGKCARPGCICLATSTCSACQKDQYCSGECQKLDWKNHKLACKTLKKLSNKLEPYSDVVQLIQSILQEDEKPTKTLRFLTHLLSYAEFQFGDRIAGQDYRHRGDAEGITNYGVEIDIMFPIYEELVAIYTKDMSLSHMNQCDMIIPYLEKMIEILRPWQILLVLTISI
jgi:hypothetical protein